MNTSIPKAPIPQQDELIVVGLDVVLAEYQQAFKNEGAHLPEVALRYLILLITSESPLDEVQLFANQIRLQLNDQRLEKLKAHYSNMKTEPIL
jgi:hypothetical protein